MEANLRVLDIEEVKSLPHVPMSHPFVERLIGSIRRELLDQTIFWTANDLENKHRDHQKYFNEHRCHSSRKVGLNNVLSDDVEVRGIAREMGLLRLALRGWGSQLRPLLEEEC